MLAYCAASVAAGFVAFPFWAMMTAPPTGVGVFVSAILVGLIWAFYIGVFAFVPAMAALALVRKTRLRRGVTDAAAGAIIGAVLITLLYQFGRPDFRFDDSDLLRAGRYGLAGLVGGLTYWLANGRPG